MGPDNIHPRALRELVDIVVKPLSIIFEKSWRLGDTPEDWKKDNVTPTYKKGLNEDPGNGSPGEIPIGCKRKIFHNENNHPLE
ncbi:mitochondrial enolase superfamily member 1 [Grus japonensis]|uniref:Mitochondrial enolase superfamily member 1 n=1 Tax=Grus japonensis TaxID=30415 RepID=A0ABC9WWG2_GRUJA